jgi:hypothetical protein
MLTIFSQFHVELPTNLATQDVLLRDYAEFARFDGIKKNRGLKTPSPILDLLAYM